MTAPDPADALRALVNAIPLSVFEDIRYRDADRYWRLADALDDAKSVLGRGAAK